ncbi:TPA: hypothetical protein TUU08_000338 [Streptococcus equi subsp. zooepidemicus]|nr:hypothetical protein [Streptococcus equi subsp. zooepidemicus]HEL0195970.1 hypothetical protein [Streptococcus equi subsp. zooepidemicus]HEL0206109.1 hypothetical protein [Streptococcus equi subsp. zooepidemicus]HEL0531770.1 hypothetical protein [Streptococcus equi subsp. zooepidemicus]HEL0567825.1 hypothetical protein [Streptococcus equi subsp. zooepidemicus]
MKNDHWIDKKYQRWEKMYKRLGHSLLTIGVLVGSYGIFLIMQGNHQTGFLLFILGPILLIASCLCYYVFTEPTSLREYLINSYDERNRAIRQKTQAYCFCLFAVLFVVLAIFFPNMTIKELFGYNLPLIVFNLYVMIRAWVSKHM